MVSQCLRRAHSACADARSARRARTGPHTGHRRTSRDTQSAVRSKRRTPRVQGRHRWVRVRYLRERGGGGRTWRGGWCASVPRTPNMQGPARSPRVLLTGRCPPSRSRSWSRRSAGSGAPGRSGRRPPPTLHAGPQSGVETSEAGPRSGHCPVTGRARLTARHSRWQGAPSRRPLPLNDTVITGAPPAARHAGRG